MKKKLLKQCVILARKEYDKHSSKFRHWTFVVQENKIIGWATNTKVDTPLFFLGYKDFQHVHSEPMALKRTWGLINHKKYFSVVNIRLLANKELAMAKPCEVCFPFLIACGAREIIWSTENSFEEIIL